MEKNLAAAVEHEVFQALQMCSEKLGLKAFVIGGYVRDFLLKRPCKDIDIVVEGKGIALAKAFSRATNSRDVVIYERFGTAMVRYKDFEVEFVGARKESYRKNSRKPIVEAGSLKDDQLRRDFTINALSISLNKENFGMLQDPFEGLADLKAGIIRTPRDPKVTFSDDPLRMMRCIRFATQLDFEIEASTYKGIIENKQRIKIVSPERIHVEINKIILANPPSKGFKLLFNTGLLHLIFPELANMHGREFIDGRGHKDNFYHTLKVLDNITQYTDNLWLRWAAILHDIAKPLTKRYEPEIGWSFHGHEDKGARMVPKIFRRLRLPLNDQMRYVQKLVRLHQRPIALVEEHVSDSAIRRLIFEAGDHLQDLLTLCRADITSKNPNKVKRYLENYELLATRIKEVEERDQLRNWQPPVTGDIIMKAFNLQPSRTVGLIKTEVREAILDGLIPNDKELAIAYMYKIAPKYL